MLKQIIKKCKSYYQHVIALSILAVITCWTVADTPDYDKDTAGGSGIVVEDDSGTLSCLVDTC